MTDLLYSTGDAFIKAFQLMPALGNLPNTIFIAVGFVLIVFWISRLVQYNKEERR